MGHSEVVRAGEEGDHLGLAVVVPDYLEEALVQVVAVLVHSLWGGSLLEVLGLPGALGVL
jgi:hypothetical protein